MVNFRVIGSHRDGVFERILIRVHTFPTRDKRQKAEKLGRVEHSLYGREKEKKRKKKKKGKKEKEKSFEGINFPVGRARNVSGEEE